MSSFMKCNCCTQTEEVVFTNRVPDRKVSGSVCAAICGPTAFGQSLMRAFSSSLPAMPLFFRTENKISPMDCRRLCEYLLLMVQCVPQFERMIKVNQKSAKGFERIPVTLAE